MTASKAPTAFADPPAAGSHVRYVRRKPGKGLVVLCSVERAQAGEDLLCLTLSEDGGGLDGHAVRVLLDAAGRGGEVDAPARATVRLLPDDPGLPGLNDAWSPLPEDMVCRELEAMLAQDGTQWRIVAASAVPLRYKPASRCVIRYHLGLTRGLETSDTTVYAKLFARPEQADAVDGILRRLAAIWDLTGPWHGCSPRSLGVVGSLGMNVTDAADQGSDARSGHSVLRPSTIQTPGGRRASSAIPTAELRLVAGALARLHTSGLGVDGLPARTGGDESQRASQRGALLAGFLPLLSSRVEAVAGRITAALARLESAEARPCHGGLKPSQLLFCADGHLAVVDWDGFCAADPALDVGYFAAYLRPPSLWYDRPGVRSWFAGAVRSWLDLYCDEMTARGVLPDMAPGIVGRAAVYEAALLLKIATRRVNRLNSARPRELVAILAEAERCLATAEAPS